jgi:hypothetical protein
MLIVHNPEFIGFVWAPDERGSPQLTPREWPRFPIISPAVYSMSLITNDNWVADTASPETASDCSLSQDWEI